MSNSVIAASNPARDVLNSIIRHAHGKASRANMIKRTTEYGAYCNAFECDINLIVETIKDTPRTKLADALNDLYSWYWKMDCIAGKQH